MEIEEAVVAYLKAYTGLTALTSTRIFPDERPQDVTTLPSITYMLVSDVKQHTLTGKLKQERPVYQFSVYAATRASAKAVAAQIKAALSDYHGTMSGVVVEKIQLNNELCSTYKSTDGSIKTTIADLEFEITYIRE